MRFFDAGGQSHPVGVKLSAPMRTHDGRTVDSTGAFLVGELERLDQKMHGPLLDTSWERDIDLREDVTVADEASSYTITTFASGGGLGSGTSATGGKAWAGRDSTQITNVSIDIGKITHPLIPYAIEIKYTIFELESAAKAGRPVDTQKYEALATKHRMDLDAMAYIGDTDVAASGLLNHTSAITPVNVAAGASGKTQWVNKTPDEILTDVNAALTSTWYNTGYGQMPEKIILPPDQYGFIAMQKVSLAGVGSTLEYIKRNNIRATEGMSPLQIVPAKWALGAGVGGTALAHGTVDRMVVYSQKHDFVRFPVTMLQRTPVQYDGLYHKTTYFAKFGEVETVYPETIGYYDQI